MSIVIRIPRPPLPSSVGVHQITPEERLITRCEGTLHVFGDIPGRCQCGQEWWDGDTRELELGPA